MKYITGCQALNLPCSLETSGDWHTSALRWDKLNFRESNNSFFGEYGIEEYNNVPENEGTFYIANTLRALLDLLCEGTFSVAQGAKDDFICNDKYTQEFFEHVYMMRNLSNWDCINKFMKREYMFEWVEYLKQKGE